VVRPPVTRWKWLAYESNETGDFQVYVRPLAEGGARQQCLVDGGRRAGVVARRDPLYYRHDDEFPGRDIDHEAGARRRRREVLFKGDYPVTTGHANYDVAPDGKHLLLLRPVSDSVRAIVVHDWASEFRAKVAAAGR
jgi:hypothetical protein